MDAQNHYRVHQQLSGHEVKQLRLVVLHQHHGEDQATFWQKYEGLKERVRNPPSGVKLSVGEDAGRH